jgi:cob(I)alamin adenosyltransferase
VKDHIRIESYGTVDELNSVRDQEMNTHYKDTLAEIQDRLFTIGAILATPQEKR